MLPKILCIQIKYYQIHLFLNQSTQQTIQLQSRTVLLFTQYLTIRIMHSLYSLEALVVILILICYIFTSHFVQIKKIPYLHQSVVAIALGALVGGIFALAIHKDIQFSNQIFFTFILPPIIFAAGYNLRKSLFFQNFGIIGFLGIIGTVICFIILTALISFFNHFIFGDLLSTPEVLLLSSVLCATDTVAALSLVRQQQFPVLNAVLFGEGIINDAVAIILFNTIHNFVFEQNQQITFLTVLLIIGDFLYLFVFSLAVGVAFGFGLSYFLKRNQSFTKFPIKQTSLILLTGYLSYLISELLSLSGIISLFTSSVIMGHYCYLNISEQSQRGTVVAFDTVGYLAEAFVFVYLGVCIFGIDGQWLAVGLAMLILLVLPLARASSVYFLPLCYMATRKQFPLKSGQLKVCWYSGLIRGAIAFALCLQIDSPHASFIKTVTLVIVLMTTIFGSLFLTSFLKWIGIIHVEQGDIRVTLNQKQSSGSSANTDQQNKVQNMVEPSQTQKSNSNSEGQQQPSNKWQKFQNEFIRPTFTKAQKKQFSYEIQTVNKISGNLNV